MVYLITALIILQSVSVLILTSYFLCDPLYDRPEKNGLIMYDFWYALTLQLANLQIYISLIWLYSWSKAFEKVKLEDDLKTIEISNKVDELAD